MNTWDRERKLFAQVLEQSLAAYKEGRLSDLDFIADLAEKDTLLWDVKNVKDKSLDAAWNFIDTFFDAVNHGRETISDKYGNEITIKHCETLAQYILERFKHGLEITREELLNFYRIT